MDASSVGGNVEAEVEVKYRAASSKSVAACAFTGKVEICLFAIMSCHLDISETFLG